MGKSTVKISKKQACLKGYLMPYRGNTLLGYGIDLRLWFEWCSQHDLKVMKVRRLDVEEYAKGMLEAGKAPSTVQRRLAAITGFYRYAEEEDLIFKSPTRYLRKPSVSRESNSKFLDRSEMTRFLSHASFIGGGSSLLAHLLTLNGLRVSEAISVRPIDVAFEGGHRVLSFIGKGDKQARVPLAAATVRALSALLEREPHPEEPLLRNTLGNPMSRSNASRAIRRLCKGAGLAKIVGPHALRHSAITAALDAGVPLRNVQVFARHADPQTTTRYDRTRMNLDQNSTYIIAAYVCGGG